MQNLDFGPVSVQYKGIDTDTRFENFITRDGNLFTSYCVSWIIKIILTSFTLQNLHTISPI